MIYLSVSILNFISEHWLFAIIIAVIIIGGILAGIGLNRVHGIFPFWKHSETTININIEIKESEKK